MFTPAQKTKKRKKLKSPKCQDVLHKQINKSLRYPSLIGQEWELLSESIKRRFVEWIPPREIKIYQGRTLEIRKNIFGIILSNLCRIIGSPLPLTYNLKGPSLVIVREANQFNGQFWTRIYTRENKPPQVIQTIKKFDGPTGLEEMLNSIIGISLTVKAQKDCIIFSSKSYFFKIWGYRLFIPSILCPGKLTVTHRENGPKRFRFTLDLIHPIFGELVYQTSIYKEIHH